MSSKQDWLPLGLCLLPGLLAFSPPLGPWLMARVGGAWAYVFGAWLVYVGLLAYWQWRGKKA